MDPQLQASSSRSITQRDLERMLLDEAAEPKGLPLSLLEDITSDFSHDQEIGSGGFAVVYKVCIPILVMLDFELKLKLC